jgi:molybdate transport system substrate-binding protein
VKIRVRIFAIAVLILFSVNLNSENIDNSSRVSLKVSAAANVQSALTEITNIFSAHYGIGVDLIFAASGKLAAQIANGAPYDVFVSADNNFTFLLHSQHLAREPRVYARGTLVLWSTRNLNLDGKLEILKDSGVVKIAIANPDLAPYGRAAFEAIRHTTFADAILKKLVYAESVTQSNQFIQTGSVEAGFTSLSSVLDPDIRNRGNYVVVDAGLYSPIDQSACILEYGRKHHPVEAEKFFSFLFSPEARKIFMKYGYQIP